MNLIAFPILMMLRYILFFLMHLLLVGSELCQKESYYLVHVNLEILLQKILILSSSNLFFHQT